MIGQKHKNNFCLLWTTQKYQLQFFFPNSNSVFIIFYSNNSLFSMKISQPNLEGSIVFKNFKIIQKIGAGAFGDIWKAQNVQINNQIVAIKTESAKARFPQLQFEARLLLHLHGQEPKEGIPQVISYGMENGYNMMIMDLLGKSLDFHFSKNNKKFSLQTVLMIGMQLIDRIQMVHSRGFVHRDIKPDNMVMGVNGKQKVVYLIDMGLSKRFMIDEEDHIPMKKGNQLVGTLRYASISNHKGLQQSRRDDIESIGYVLVYFLMGNLPWQSIKADSVKAKVQMIKNKKMSVSVQNLCKGQPSQIGKFISYSRGLKFEQKPDYEYLRGLLKNAAEKNQIPLEGKYDWDSAVFEQSSDQ